MNFVEEEIVEEEIVDFVEEEYMTFSRLGRFAKVSNFPD